MKTTSHRSRLAKTSLSDTEEMLEQEQGCTQTENTTPPELHQEFCQQSNNTQQDGLILNMCLRN